jgi:hypothetical protein
MPIFHDSIDTNAHNAFQKWREQNENGFFLNWKSPSNVMLHRVHCPHYGDTEWGIDKINKAKGWGNLGETVKVCSLDKEKLERYVRKEGTKELRYCKSCAP